MKSLILNIGLICVITLLTSCEKKAKDCEAFYLCGRWELIQLSVNGNIKQIPRFVYEISVGEADEDGYHIPDQIYKQFKVQADSVAYYYVVDGIQYERHYSIAKLWEDKGDYIRIETDVPDSMGSSYCPGFIGDPTLAKSVENWYYKNLTNEVLVLSNNETGSEIIGTFLKLRDFDCPCYAQHK